MRKVRAQFCIIGLCLIVASCTSRVRDLDLIKESGELRVLTVNSETTYFEDRDGVEKGFEYELAKAFAHSMGLKANFKVYESVSDVLDALRLGRGDFVAANISVTKKREEVFEFGPTYLETQQKLVCQNSIKPANLSELQKYEILVGADTSYAERLEKLSGEYEGLSWTEVDDQTTAELIQGVAEGRFDCTISDEHVVQIYRRYFPKLRVSMDVGSPEETAWVFPEGSEELREQAKNWFGRIRSTRLKSLRDSYFSFAEDFDPFDLKKFSERIETRLPKYKTLFRQAANKYGWRWTMLAAISYQESHWDPTAKSPTGVRGLMMLTKNTAKAMGVEDRLDPKESVMGGAKYLRKLERRVPAYIRNPDRKWMTLAAYNVGFGHLRDARGVAAWKNENPNSWAGVRNVLPLLSSRKIFKRLPHGYARGLEPVLYVDRIKNYHNILLRKLGE